MEGLQPVSKYHVNVPSVDDTSFDWDQILDELDFDDLLEEDQSDEKAVYLAKDAASEAAAAQTGIQTRSLQSAIDNYAAAMNESAIAQSTGLPVMTPPQQYKGFAAEEYLKNTLKINALVKGVPNWKIGVYTKGPMPDGILSGIDMLSKSYRC